MKLVEITFRATNSMFGREWQMLTLIIRSGLKKSAVCATVILTDDARENRFYCGRLFRQARRAFRTIGSSRLDDEAAMILVNAKVIRQTEAEIARLMASTEFVPPDAIVAEQARLRDLREWRPPRGARFDGLSRGARVQPHPCSLPKRHDGAHSEGCDGACWDDAGSCYRPGWSGGPPGPLGKVSQ